MELLKTDSIRHLSFSYYMSILERQLWRPEGLCTDVQTQMRRKPISEYPSAVKFRLANMPP